MNPLQMRAKSGLIRKPTPCRREQYEFLKLPFLRNGKSGPGTEPGQVKAGGGRGYGREAPTDKAREVVCHTAFVPR